VRSEYKYPIRMRDLPALRAELEPYLVADRNAVADDDGVYTVRSLYFDTAGFKYYQDKLDGIAKRRKVRIRVYNDRASDSVAFFEVKHKDQQWVSKSRAPVHIDNAAAFLDTGDAERFVLPLPKHPKAVEHATHFHYYLRSAHLRPVALISYERIAFHGAFDPGFRLTFDFHLRSGLGLGVGDLYREHGLKSFLRDVCVVEVKFSRGMPSWIATVLHRYDARRDAVSKYCMGIDACRSRIASPMP
jgi:hypothetical protein